MTAPDSTTSQPSSTPLDRSCYDRNLLRDQMARLRQEAATRATLETEISSESDAATTKLKKVAAAALAKVRDQCDKETAALKADFVRDRTRLEGQVEAERQALDQQLETLKDKIAREWQVGEKERTEDLEYEAISVGEQLKAKQEDTRKKAAAAEKKLNATRTTIADDLSRTQDLLTRWGVSNAAEIAFAPAESDDTPASEADAEAPPDTAATAPPLDPPLPTGKDLLVHFQELTDTVTAEAKALRQLRSARAFDDRTTALVFVIPVLTAVAVGGGSFFGLQAMDMSSEGLIAAIAAGVSLVAGIGFGLMWQKRQKGVARTEAATLVTHLAATCNRLDQCHTAALSAVAEKLERDLERLAARHAKEAQDRHGAMADASASQTSARDEKIRTLEQKYQIGCTALEEKKARGLKVLDETYPPKIEAVEQKRDQEIASIEARQQKQLTAIEEQRTVRWADMTAAWRTAREETTQIYAAAEAVDRDAFRSWQDLADGSAALPTTPPPGLRFGQIDLSLAGIPGGVSSHAELNQFGPERWQQPAFTTFPDDAALLIKTPPDQKEHASALIQALMLRIASGLPPGQSLFTIIDPLGLGKQFAGFMHLADHDEQLVSSRIWTEPGQIEERLGIVTEQMEMVIQKYLRNEYPSIGDYNAEAEVPEPYRFVVIANFPANFTETAVRRLASIASSGARCGVIPIISIDTSQTPPSNFSLEELQSYATTILLKDGRFTWNDPEFSKWPLTVETAPDDQTFTKIVQRVGKEAVAAKRVEVPFERVAPPEDAWWTGDTAKEIVVPLGPAGAKKTLSMKLGKGTSQHVLIAGKTGSGKSTMMHALITNLSLIYSPNEIQFYLIDFKKGVEFKLYDHFRLPHARVIAIESEREFGLSVLQQLDRELKRRGDLFRDLSVQDLAGYRASGHPEPMPRIMLIIDEFQELFVEDDKLAQDCSLVLDRLVRQGRAFGMHVLLGSQTLGGSYSLPRATMGQMAVRVALQCNEADSSLILSEDNTAARLLTRPGEAIYNDANGMIEGNHPFQVVWLGEERREKFLGKLRALADSRSDIPALPRLVFDGNEAADPAANRLLSELLDAGTIGGKPAIAPLAWLGDAIAIKDPTVATFRRQGGTNLLIVGQREDLATRILAMATVSLAAGSDPHPGGSIGKAARFVLLEPAIAEEHPETMISRLTEFLPHELETVGRLGVADAFADLAGEVQRRLDEQILDAESVFVIIRDLGRFRECRRDENDFGFSMSGEQKASPAQNLVTILKDGPTVGVHAIIWCDSLTNLQRTFERNTLKEFELRVLFQMSGTDSSQLVENPAAGRLGEQRALFVHEETGTLEKFRPYQFPSDEWLANVSEKLRGRPQGTPADRPRPAPKAGTPAPDDDGGFSLKHGFGADEFNFAKMLDDPPEDTPGDTPATPDDSDP
jgi:S-DNA-T family DNA segregation ATPase FtsK/SpoIIIE